MRPVKIVVAGVIANEDELQTVEIVSKCMIIRSMTERITKNRGVLSVGQMGGEMGCTK